jgi:peptidoglycan hydrolase-like amidase
MPMAFLARVVAAVLLASLLLVACRARADRGAVADNSEPLSPSAPSAPAAVRTAAPSAAEAPARAPASPVVAPRVLPALDHEPEVGVLLARGRQISLTLLAPARLQIGGQGVDLAKGPLVAEAVAGGWRLVGGGAVAAGEGLITVRAAAGQPGFAATLIPPFGKPQALKFAGRAALRAKGGVVELIERLPLEAYLAGVLPVEMNPSWPTGALAAQAIAARSYASARWLERFDQPWQLHWHFSVDMAYGGWRKASPNVAAALGGTRGQVLMTRGMPVLALFHASSGGTTESAANLWPTLVGPDGRTPIAAVMRVAGDDAASAGAKGLGLSQTHLRWKADVPLVELSSGLKAWAAEKPGERPAIGAVTGIRVGRRFADSKRVATVVVTHRLGKRSVETAVAGNDFRLAVGPGVVRSTAWDRCVIASKGGGTLVLEGRGFGHGVGLSQVSAWWLAGKGVAPAEIVARFYPGADLRTVW